MQIEKELLILCQKKDRRAQFQLYRNCFSVLMSVCLRYKPNRSEAEEVLNTGFLKVLTNLNKYNESVPFDAWIRRIMINTLIDDYRTTQRHREVIQYTDFNETPYISQEFDLNEAQKQFDSEDLEKLLRELPPLTQKVFNLYAIDGYSHKEIATMLFMAEGTSKWHVSNARKILQEKIASITAKSLERKNNG